MKNRQFDAICNSTQESQEQRYNCACGFDRQVWSDKISSIAVKSQVFMENLVPTSQQQTNQYGTVSK